MGGGGNNAQKAAERQERERQAAIGQSVGQINSVFDNPNRKREIDDFVGATREFYLQDLNRQKGLNDRDLKFSLARSGQTGGSVAIDQNREAGEMYSRGLLDVDRRAQGAGADLRAQDEQGRMNLLAMAQSGLDATTASQQAANAMRNNLEAGKATSRAQGLGEAFGGFADIIKRSRDQAAERRGYRDIYNAFYQPGFGYAGGKP